MPTPPTPPTSPTSNVNSNPISGTGLNGIFNQIAGNTGLNPLTPGLGMGGFLNQLSGALSPSAVESALMPGSGSGQSSPSAFSNQGLAGLNPMGSSGNTGLGGLQGSLGNPGGGDNAGLGQINPGLKGPSKAPEGGLTPLGAQGGAPAPATGSMSAQLADPTAPTAPNPGVTHGGGGPTGNFVPPTVPDPNGLFGGPIAGSGNGISGSWWQQFGISDATAERMHLGISVAPTGANGQPIAPPPGMTWDTTASLLNPSSPNAHVLDPNAGEQNLLARQNNPFGGQWAPGGTPSWMAGAAGSTTPQWEQDINNTYNRGIGSGQTQYGSSFTGPNGETMRWGPNGQTQIADAAGNFQDDAFANLHLPAPAAPATGTGISPDLAGPAKAAPATGLGATAAPTANLGPGLASQLPPATATPPGMPPNLTKNQQDAWTAANQVDQNNLDSWRTLDFNRLRAGENVFSGATADRTNEVNTVLPGLSGTARTNFLEGMQNRDMGMNPARDRYMAIEAATKGSPMGGYRDPLANHFIGEGIGVPSSMLPESVTSNPDFHGASGNEWTHGAWNPTSHSFEQKDMWNGIVADDPNFGRSEFSQDADIAAPLLIDATTAAMSAGAFGAGGLTTAGMALLGGGLGGYEGAVGAPGAGVPSGQNLALQLALMQLGGYLNPPAGSAGLNPGAVPA